MQVLLEVLGRPQDQLRAFHVGGTNGKGSVTATLGALLRAQGRRVGLYTSPHLVDFRERFVVDGRTVTEQDVTDWIARRTPVVERLGATFFEATTAMAFELFAAANVEVCVIEVGLGGRLDATNVLTPLAAGVASIGIDHVEYLGDTKEQIAYEKAGIFKKGQPAVIGEPDLVIRSLLARHAHTAGAAPVVIAADEVTVSDIVVEKTGGTSFYYSRRDDRPVRLHTGLAGAHQASNTTVALLMLDAAGPPYRMPAADAARTLKNVVLPGRFQRVGRWIFDVAHNPDSVSVLTRTLAAVAPPRPIVAVLSVLADKDWRAVMSTLAPAVDRFILTSAPTAPESRAWRPEEALVYANANAWVAEVDRDFDHALAVAHDAGGTALVTGSFHTVGDAMASLQVSPLAG